MKFKVGQKVKFLASKRFFSDAVSADTWVTGRIIDIRPVDRLIDPIRVLADDAFTEINMFYGLGGDLGIGFSLEGNYFHNSSQIRLQPIPPLLKRRKDDSHKNETPTTSSK